jgi:hypothetical protein
MSLVIINLVVPFTRIGGAQKSFLSFGWGFFSAGKRPDWEGPEGPFFWFFSVLISLDFPRTLSRKFRNWRTILISKK